MSASLSLPNEVRDLASLKAWIAAQPIRQQDRPTMDEADPDGRYRSVSMGWDISIGIDEDTPARRDAVQRELAREAAFVLLGIFAASPEGIIWRIRPDLQIEDIAAGGCSIWIGFRVIVCHLPLRHAATRLNEEAAVLERCKAKAA